MHFSKKAIILITTFFYAAQIFGSDGVHFIHRDKNIGFPLILDSIFLRKPCLKPQILFNTQTTIHIGSAVEPSLGVNPKNPKHIVACWQQNRINNSGALEIGIAYSKNGGACWKRTYVPFQICLGGISQRISDPWLSYSADGKKVYLAVLYFNVSKVPATKNQNGIAVSVSEDGGESWSCPHNIVGSQLYLNEPTGQFPLFDKNSITADPNHSKYAYVVWDRYPMAISFHSDTELSLTKNGGKTWSTSRIIYDPFIDLNGKKGNGIYNDYSTLNNIIAVLPKGDVLNFMTRYYSTPNATDAQYTHDSFPYQYTLIDLAFIRSMDLGYTWDSSATFVANLDINSVVFTGGYTYDSNGNISGGIGTMLRASNPVFSVSVNPENGYLYLVWQTGQFRSDRLPQIALSTSRDGGNTWSPPVQVNRTPTNTPNPQAFTPFVAVAKNGVVGILYNDFRNDKKDNPNETNTDAWLVLYQELEDPQGGSLGIGLDMKEEVRLSKRSYIAQNGPTTTQGVMTNGDYSFLVAVNKTLYAIYTKSFKGPFRPTRTLFTDQKNDAELLLDYNYRQAPFISILESRI